MGFNEAQTKAICHKNGPAMVLAGPGSGKTLVITRRVEYLIKKYGVRPEQILVITFTSGGEGDAGAICKNYKRRSFSSYVWDFPWYLLWDFEMGIPDECIKYFFGGRKDDAFKGSYCRDGIGDRR